MATESPHTAIITLNVLVNGLSSPKKMAQGSRLDQKQNPAICCLQETHLSCKDKNRLKMKGWKMICQARNIHRKAGVAILTSDKMDLQVTKVIREKDGHFILVKGTLHKKT